MKGHQIVLWRYLKDLYGTSNAIDFSVPVLGYQDQDWIILAVFSGVRDGLAKCGTTTDDSRFVARKS